MAQSNGPVAHYLPAKAVPYVKQSLQLIARLAGVALGVLASSKLLFETALADVRKLGSHYDVNRLLYGTKGPEPAQKGKGTPVDKLSQDYGAAKEQVVGSIQSFDHHEPGKHQTAIGSAVHSKGTDQFGDFSETVVNGSESGTIKTSGQPKKTSRKTNGTSSQKVGKR